MLHGSRYDYSSVKYKANSYPVDIICSIHGVFKQKPTYHLRGHGCSVCGGSKPSNTEEFIKKSQVVHGLRYDYSDVDYLNANSKVSISCKLHGSFKQECNSHLQGAGCPICKGGVKQTKLQFVEKARLIHGDKYDYSSVSESDGESKRITCKKHGNFMQIGFVHLRGAGCPKCAGFNKTKAEFIIEAKEVHGDVYSYAKSEYTRSTKKIEIVCEFHGSFFQRPVDHIINMQGCAKCRLSKGEIRIDKYLKETHISFETQKSFPDSEIPRLKFDFYLPEFNLLIEFNGKQHYSPIAFYGGRKKFKRQQQIDVLKKSFASQNGYRFLVIPYNEESPMALINNAIK